MRSIAPEREGPQSVVESVGRFRDSLPFWERLRYLLWRFSMGYFPIELKMKSGAILPLRSWRYHDYHTAYEVFVAEFYKATLSNAKTIVDLGANVGFATLYFAFRYDDSKLYCFEPHPAHFECLSHLVKINKLDSRVMLYNAAVGASNRKATLSDAGTCSTLIEKPTTDVLIQATVMDLFEWADKIGGIDVLKMDIEGGEYPILFDDRFVHLECSNIVMEYHPTDDCADTSRLVLDRLAEVGYRARVVHTMADGVGIIHAEKP